MTTKVKTLEELSLIISDLKSKRKKVIQCHGVFDLLHPGHLVHFEQAKAMGDILVVTVTPDKYVNKGIGRPIFSQSLRTGAVAKNEDVDYVAINKWPTAVETIRCLKPDVYVKGSDYKDAVGDIDREREAIESIGGKITFTDDITFSSSNLLNRLTLPENVNQYLSQFPYSANDVLNYLKNAYQFKVLIVGESIIDEYQYCEAIGTSAKEPILAVRQLHSERFDGGILAVEKHVANFCRDVSKITTYPPIVKRRFVESYLLQKLFEVYEIDEERLTRETEGWDLCEKLNEALPQYDIVIVVDYGHGMLNEEAVDILCRKSCFLAVNAQTNAGNRGFNTISKYPRADYVTLTRPELWLDGKRCGDVKDMILSLSRKCAYGKIAVTCGKDGIICYDGKFVETPAFTDKVVDRMGAGDAVLAITTLCVAQRASMEIVGFVGNAVGAQAVNILGHRESIEKEKLFKYITTLLK